jgi:hypothetical protein
MLGIHLLTISMKSNFKSTIRFVGTNLNPTKPTVDLKISSMEMGKGWIYIISQRKDQKDI